MLLRRGETRVLFDCGPDFRQQALAHKIRRLDAVVLSHQHADHLLGMDDLRLLILHQRRPMPVYGVREVLDRVVTVYPYAFGEPPSGSFRPQFELHVIEQEDAPFEIDGLSIQPVPVVHSNVATLGFRLGDFAYLSDCKEIPAASRELLQGLDMLVLDGLRQRPHPTHMNLDEALAAIESLAPKQAWLTHLTHDFDAATDEALLPEGVRFAYDGLTFALPD